MMRSSSVLCFMIYLSNKRIQIILPVIAVNFIYFIFVSSAYFFSKNQTNLKLGSLCKNNTTGCYLQQLNTQYNGNGDKIKIFYVP